MFETIQLTTESFDKPLDWRDRPAILCDKISSQFRAISQRALTSWTYRGDKTYYLCAISEFNLIRQLIHNNPDQKEFAFLDLGAGDFTLFRTLEQRINEDDSIPANVVIHLVSVRAEVNTEQERVNGKCRVYEWGTFSIECLESELNGKKFTLNFNAIFSRWTFIHLIDPMGTFIQVYNRLKPNTGLLLTDGFNFLMQDKSEAGSYTYRNNFFRLLLQLKVPFLVDTYDPSFLKSYTLFFNRVAVSINHVILKRPDDKPCELPLNYRTLLVRQHISTHHIVGFDVKAGTEMAETGQIPYHSPGMVNMFYGDKDFFDGLEKEKILKNTFYHGPLVRLESAPSINIPKINANSSATSFNAS